MMFYVQTELNSIDQQPDRLVDKHINMDQTDKQIELEWIRFVQAGVDEGEIDKQIDRQTDSRIDGQMVEQLEMQMQRCIGQTDRHTETHIDGGLDRQIDGQMSSFSSSSNSAFWTSCLEHVAFRRRSNSSSTICTPGAIPSGDETRSIGHVASWKAASNTSEQLKHQVPCFD